MIHLPNLFFAVNMSSGAAKCLSSLPSPVLVDSSVSAGCSALGLSEHNHWLLNLQTLNKSQLKTAAMSVPMFSVLTDASLLYNYNLNYS